MRNIKVSGQGELSLKPDTICLIIKTKGVEKEYEEAVKKSAEATRILKEYLEKSGLPAEDLKTSSFSINAEYESYRDFRDEYKKKFIGYSFHHDTSIDFPNDNKQLGKTLYAISHCPVKVQFSIQYTVKDKEAAKKELLKLAVQDAKSKAEVLAEASGVKLGDVQDINYSWDEVHIYSQPVDMAPQRFASARAMNLEDSYDIDINADDIKISDSVNVVWEIV